MAIRSALQATYSVVAVTSVHPAVALGIKAVEVSYQALMALTRTWQGEPWTRSAALTVVRVAIRSVVGSRTHLVEISLVMLALARTPMRNPMPVTSSQVSVATSVVAPVATRSVVTRSVVTRSVAAVLAVTKVAGSRIRSAHQEVAL